MTFAETIRAQRRKLGLSQAELAALLDVSKSAVEKWEYGTKEPIPIAQEGALARIRKCRKHGQPGG